MTMECTCGNYTPYGDTIPPGFAVCAMMPFDACVHCYDANLDRLEEVEVEKPKTLQERLKEFKDRK
jgi:hypothetical protein